VPIENGLADWDPEVLLCDLADLNEVESLPLDRFLATFAGKGITLINNVAVKDKTSFLEEASSSWISALNVSVSAAFFLTQRIVKFALTKNARLNVCNISSVLASQVGPLSASYGVSKAGLNYLTRYFASLGNSLGIQVRAVGVAPGLIVQDRWVQKYVSPDNHQFRMISELLHTGTPFGTEGELASTVFWLSEEAPEFLNGETLCFDGGISLREPLYMSNKLLDLMRNSEI
jgi:NAD(P)-dependent dehydrogenase (short-subunit alcohol dehydrogenase family)